MSKDYYNILQIDKNATDDDIKKNYRKLALLYHPDKNKGNDDATNKFKEISEAYSVLSNPDKRQQYDLLGSIDGEYNQDDNDPFDIFNNIFQQHMSTFMNMRYDNDLNINSILSNLTGLQDTNLPFNNIHIKVHTYPVDLSNDIDNSNMNGLFSNLFSNLSNFNNIHDDTIKDKHHNKHHIKTKHRTKSSTEIMYDKPDPIIYKLNVSLQDIYDMKNTKITITRKRLVDNKYINKHKKISIPTYAKEIILTEQGDQLKNYKQKGDVIIELVNNTNNNDDSNIDNNNNKFKRINEYDVLTFVDIKLKDLYTAYNYELILPNKEVLFIQTEKMNLNKILVQKVIKKGLPYKINNDDTEWLRGNLYIMYNVIYPDINELHNITITEDNTNINDYCHIAYNCDIFEIINE